MGKQNEEQNEEQPSLAVQMLAYFAEQNKRIARQQVVLFAVILCLIGYILYDRHLDSLSEEYNTTEITQTIDNDELMGGGNINITPHIQNVTK